ncbi:hypothetical protein OA610_01000 [Prochlorococcus sp. AH-716-F13]|nr:hypothetical protein [Prochlorococcus sp. AH-716-F13]
MGYIVVLILTAYAEADMRKEIKDALLNCENAKDSNLIKIN